MSTLESLAIVGGVAVIFLLVATALWWEMVVLPRRDAERRHRALDEELAQHARAQLRLIEGDGDVGHG